MDIKKKITIELSEDDVKDIVSKFLKSQGYNVSKENIEMNVGTELRGYGVNEHPVTYFKNCIAKCDD